MEIFFIFENILIVISLNLKCIKLVKQHKLTWGISTKFALLVQKLKKTYLKWNTGDQAVTNATI
jgi:hypothetical protein